MKWEVFKHYKTDNFIETGTYLGEAIKHALKYGFKNIRSVEIVKDLYLINKKFFKDYENIKLYNGDSGYLLWKMIEDISGQMTFWLDGHFHPAGKNRIDNTKNISWGKSNEEELWTPLKRELKAIKKHPIKNHIIIIDDIREFPSKEYGSLSCEDLEKMLLEINKDYQFTYHKGVTTKDILVAHIN